MTKAELIHYLNGIGDKVNEVSLEIWNHPEVSGQESKSADVFRQVLREHGFTIKELGEGLEHAFFAEYGNGSPVMAVLGEYDALPGLSQRLDTRANPTVKGGPGHACGHNLLGAGALGGALAIKKYLEETGRAGTVRFYGCPEEESLIGKVKMIKAGAFEGCDLALNWHPMNINAALETAFLAANSIKFKFHGISAHAALSPESGRSALDAVEIMNVGANYLREHISDDARVHYTITSGGGSPNIIPEEAESWYYVRAPHRHDVGSITARLLKIAEGAALMTETRVEHTILGGCYHLLPNKVLCDLTYKNLTEMMPPTYGAEELEFARAIQESLDPAMLAGEIRKFMPDQDDMPYIHQGVLDQEQAKSVVFSGSSDSGDVSWIMPTNLFLAAAWPLGVPAHSWQATSASGSSLGTKAVHYASRVFAGIMYDLLNDASLVEAAQDEFGERTKNDKYVCPLPSSS
ncbi:MAG: amidohydrolase [Limnochordia bacterium]|nr:amidohydrolase [Limnochordia bacterium]